jgi:cytidyltransferase-like protein
MIVTTDDLPKHAGEVTMVDGGFDPIHAGHIDYFRAAAALGHPVLCNVSSDGYVSTKHAPLLPEDQRIRVLDAIRYLDLVHLSRTTTADVLRTLRPAAYAKGDDWEGRLPEEELRICDEFGIEIVYLDTVTQSSTRLLAAYREQAYGDTT